jgi:GT2 family glycosyltransferase
MNTYYKHITIIIITYNSNNEVIKFITKIPKIFQVVIVDNSNDISLRSKFKNNKNIKLYFHKNNGVGTSLNFAVRKTKTQYFFQVSPDLKFNFRQLEIFYNEGKKLENKFSALGPRFTNADKKGHVQSSKKEKIGKIHAVHGSAMYISKKVFNKIGGIDENIFLYFEENDYCLRGRKLGLKAYQINKTYIKKKGQTVKFKKKNEKIELLKLLSWHYIWSEFYFHKKNKGYFFAIIYFCPLLIRTIFKFLLYGLLRNNNNLVKYKYRLKGLLSSMMNQKSYLRL